MKFSEMEYVRPNLEDIKQQFKGLLQQFKNADHAEAQIQTMNKINHIRNSFDSMSQLVYIRHTVDTNDEFYKKEQEFMDENTPIMQDITSKLYKALVNSKFRDQLEEKFGRQLFDLAELTLKTFSPEIIEDLQLENKLSSDYVKLMASAKIQFEGEELNLTQLSAYSQSSDRIIRKKADNARTAFFVEHEEKIDDIYDQLVKIRTKIAKSLGYKTFTELGYNRMTRTDYDARMVANFRKQVREIIVPLATKLRKRQQERINVPNLYNYDEGFDFKTGNAAPKGDAEWIVNQGKKMYKELSPETNEFFQFMANNELMDLVSKKGKAGGGYCTYINEYGSPFIFANFNGTSDDIDILTHEAGHAFQVYTSRSLNIPEYQWPTAEACEIHSMSMEFLTWPWMELLFEENTEKYKFSHLSGAILFIPYGVAVDEFQHFVYDYPQATPQQRKAKWREIEKTYLPHRMYDDNEYLENGGFWHKQSHIFKIPFYYIDYTLAQICALQFWKRSAENPAEAWDDYLHLCKLGGSKSFVELVTEASLISPFENGCVQSVVGEIEAWLNEVDDKQL
ncbi:M3 family oligoendopeptidase [Chengkuizengella axinellae]|uniref:M3 family oligoendopeptidase n=1 Tax=Chengkuizengella axinellae TaxID=3064388 RepID=A0ABT9IWU4_9BACL|nr:M3 family oligoendopeptidase [Chengkuizengella sp. 2205SS18-9]MDP5273572.1 M3 family oligoendopeptidase [Chengkuizengella sp. 2205SS18-9]